MKSLVVFVTPNKKFFGEYVQLVRVFIDNSIDLGYRLSDILLVTNFPYEYNGVQAAQVGDEHFCESRPRSIKTAIVPHLMDIGFIKDGDVCWNHDLDAFQMTAFDESELGLDGYDAGLTDYGWKSRWCMGSYFVKTSAKDIFEAASPIIHSNVEDEDAIQRLHDSHDVERRCKRLNITYNFGMRKVEFNFGQSDPKPIRVVHFHPTYKLARTWDVFVLGKNGLGFPLVSDRLIGVFKHHGIGYGV